MKKANWNLEEIKTFNDLTDKELKETNGGGPLYDLTYEILHKFILKDEMFGVPNQRNTTYNNYC